VFSFGWQAHVTSEQHLHCKLNFCCQTSEHYVYILNACLLFFFSALIITTVYPMTLVTSKSHTGSDLENKRATVSWSIICHQKHSIYACNELNLMHYLSSVYWVTTPLQVSGLLVAHHQEVAMYNCHIYMYMWQLVHVVRLSRLSAGVDGMEAGIFLFVQRLVYGCKTE
jgi:hypothetical protein